MTSTWDYNNSYELRLEMVAEQLKYRGIVKDDILRAFTEVPRHLFIPHVPIQDSYGDHPIPIPAGQTISQPFIVALMIDYLELEVDHTVLEIGSGSGYATAILAKLCRYVDAYEVYSELIRGSQSVLKQLSINNVSFNHHSAWEQLPEGQVYDRVILWASPPRIPPHLFKSLSDGGILVAPEGKGHQHVWIYKKSGEQLTHERKDAVRFVPLVQGSATEINGSLEG